MNENFINVIIKSLNNSQHKCNYYKHQLIKNVAKNQQHLKMCDAFKKSKRKNKRENSTKNQYNYLLSFLFVLYLKFKLHVLFVQLQYLYI